MARKESVGWEYGAQGSHALVCRIRRPLSAGGGIVRVWCRPDGLWCFRDVRGADRTFESVVEAKRAAQKHGQPVEGTY